MKIYVKILLSTMYIISLFPAAGFTQEDLREPYRPPVKDPACDLTLSGNLKSKDLQNAVDRISDKNKDKQFTLCLAANTFVLLEKIDGSYGIASGVSILNKNINLIGILSEGRASYGKKPIIGNRNVDFGSLVHVGSGGVLKIKNIDLVSHARWSKGIYAQVGSKILDIDNCGFYQYGTGTTGIDAYGFPNFEPIVINRITNSTFILNDISKFSEFSKRNTGINISYVTMQEISKVKVTTFGNDDYFLNSQASKIAVIKDIVSESSTNIQYGNYAFFSLNKNTEIGILENLKSKVSLDAYYYLLMQDSRIKLIRNINLELSGKADSIFFAGLYQSAFTLESEYKHSRVENLSNVAIISSIPRAYNSEAVIQVGKDSILEKVTNLTLNGKPAVIDYRKE